MARGTKAFCNRCDGRLGAGPYCPKCGYPTPYASHEDRVEWELRQWSAPNAAATVAATPMKQSASVITETRTRRWFRSRDAANGAPKPSGGNGHKAEAVNGNGNGHRAATENGHGHTSGDPVQANGHGAAEQTDDGPSPFAPPPAEVKKPSVNISAPEPEQAKAPSTNPAKTPKKQAATKAKVKAEIDTHVATAAKPAKPAKSAKPKAKPKVESAKNLEPAKRKAPLEKVVAEVPQPEPKIAPTREAANISQIRPTRRLPSVADIEAAAKQGPSIVKILRLIQLRAAVHEAQMADEKVAKTG